MTTTWEYHAEGDEWFSAKTGQYSHVPEMESGILAILHLEQGNICKEKNQSLYQLFSTLSTQWDPILNILMLDSSDTNFDLMGVGCGLGIFQKSIWGYANVQLRLRTFGIHILCNPHNYSCHFLFFKKFFNWSIVELKCCVGFWYTAKWFSYTHILIYIFFLIFFSIMVTRYWI